MILYNKIVICIFIIFSIKMEIEGINVNMNENNKYNHNNFIDYIYTSSKLYHYNKNTEKIKRRIDEKIIDIPSDTDKDGYIYGFTYNIIPNFNNYYIKIGRSVDPINRVIKQWKGELIFCIHTPYNKKAESLIHLYLNYARRILEDDTGKTHIEWFYFENKEDIIGLIMAIRDLIIKNDCVNRYKENNDHIELGNLKNPQIYNKFIDLENDIHNLKYEDDPNIKEIMNNVDIILNKYNENKIEEKIEIEEDQIKEINNNNSNNKGILYYLKYYFNKLFCCLKPN